MAPIDMTLVKAITYEEELKKNAELKESDIQILREWCAKQYHLPKISDVQLALFLHSNYFRMEPTKTTIETYCTMRSQLPELFSSGDPFDSKEFRQVYTTVTFFGLEKPTDEGYRITYTKLLDSDPSHYHYDSCTRFTNMICDLWLHTYGSSPGHVLILNARGLSLGHLSRISLIGLKSYVDYLQDALPIRLKRIHFMNAVPVVKILIRMIKPFLRKELYEMIHLHSTIDELENLIPVDTLPKDDGGKGENVADMTAAYIKWLEDNRAWFQTEEAMMTVNESLRVGTCKTSSNLLGVEGNFKQRDID